MLAIKVEDLPRVAFFPRRHLTAYFDFLDAGDNERFSELQQ
ncbi:hypothetical protein [Pseudomonas soli]